MNRKDHCRVSSGHPPSQSIKQGVSHEDQISSKWELTSVLSLGPELALDMFTARF